MSATGVSEGGAAPNSSAGAALPADTFPRLLVLTSDGDGEDVHGLECDDCGEFFKPTSTVWCVGCADGHAAEFIRDAATRKLLLGHISRETHAHLLEIAHDLENQP